MKNTTRDHILTVFNEMMDRQAFEKITVEKICREAGISKPTFYRYYKDKYDVMTYNFRKLFDRYLVLALEGDLEGFLTVMYRSTQDNFEPIRRTFEILGRNSMNDVIYSICVGALVEWLADKQDGEITNEQRIQCDILAYGISYIGDNWINGRYDMTPEEAASATMAIMPPELREMN